MTEKEYMLEMLCCTPMELLEKRLENKEAEIPSWLLGIPKALIEEAITIYYKEPYAKKRTAFILARTMERPLLVFCGTRAKSEDMARELAPCFEGDAVRYYHAGMTKE